MSLRHPNFSDWETLEVTSLPSRQPLRFYSTRSALSRGMNTGSVSCCCSQDAALAVPVLPLSPKPVQRKLRARSPQAREEARAGAEAGPGSGGGRPLLAAGGLALQGPETAGGGGGAEQRLEWEPHASCFLSGPQRGPHGFFLHVVPLLPQRGHVLGSPALRGPVCSPGERLSVTTSHVTTHRLLRGEEGNLREEGHSERGEARQ